MGDNRELDASTAFLEQLKQLFICSGAARATGFANDARGPLLELQVGRFNIHHLLVPLSATEEE